MAFHFRISIFAGMCPAADGVKRRRNRHGGGGVDVLKFGPKREDPTPNDTLLQLSGVGFDI